MTSVNLSASIVIYRANLAVLGDVVGALARSVCESHVPCVLFVIDNDGTQQGAAFLATLDETTKASFARIELIHGQGNVGYGAGHNLAIRRTDARYHLILNPDAILEASAVTAGVAFLEQHADVILLAPAVFGGRGELQYLCRRPPTLTDLFLRGFAPAALRRRFAARLARYEMQDVINTRDIVFDPPIVSGCCMLFRSAALLQLNGFDERYFLYFEDYDLSLRAHARGRTAYLPAMRLTHLGGDAARKGFAHVRMFGTSALTFFSQHGWHWW